VEGSEEKKGRMASAATGLKNYELGGERKLRQSLKQAVSSRGRERGLGEKKRTLWPIPDETGRGLALLLAASLAAIYWGDRERLARHKTTGRKGEKDPTIVDLGRTSEKKRQPSRPRYARGGGMCYFSRNLGWGRGRGRNTANGYEKNGLRPVGGRKGNTGNRCT